MRHHFYSFLTHARLFRIVSMLLWISLFPISIHAETEDSATEEKSAPLRVSLLIQGPSERVYTYWGHIGLIIENLETDEKNFYDFGNFSFYSPNFYSQFILGKMRYRGAKSSPAAFIDAAINAGYDLRTYPLNLSPSAISDLEKALELWMLPENQEYLYDYFLNNCSTIIRDLLNDATGGALKANSEKKKDRSYRYYARTGSSSSLVMETLLHYLLGPTEDLPISLWDKMFLPKAVADEILKLDYRDTDGHLRRMGEEEIIFNKLPPVPTEPRRLWPLLLLLGVLIAAMGMLARLAENPLLRILGTVGRVLSILMVGFPGLMLTFFMLVTDHSTTFGNVNLWPSLPSILLGLIPALKAGKYTGRAREEQETVLAWIWTVNLIGFLIAMLFVFSGLTKQDTGAFWLFYGPLTLLSSFPILYLQRRLRF